MKRSAIWVKASCLLGIVAVLTVFSLPNSVFAAPKITKMADIYAEPTTRQWTLDIESALARTQARLGIIPMSAAEEITKRADISFAPKEAIDEERKKVGHPLVATINVWIKSMEGDAGEFVHYGATTQDIFDTMYVLQVRAAAKLILQDLREIEAIMMDMAQKHKNTPMVGRTLGQHALPITFGLKVGVWIGENRRNIERLKDCMARINTGILAGAVGSYAGLGEKGFETEELFVKELGLGAPEPVDWHGTKDKFAEFGNVLAMIGMTYGKIGQEIFLLQSTDLAEVEEYASTVQVGSSTMPQKRNPSGSRTMIVQSRKIRQNAEILMDWMMNFYERDQISHADELKEICMNMDRLLKTSRTLLKELIVKPDTMRANLDRTKGLIMAEKLMFVLGDKVGKHNAHEIIRERAMEAFNKDITFKEALLSDVEVAKHLNNDELDEVLDPTKYTGLSAQQVDRVINYVNELRKKNDI